MRTFKSFPLIDTLKDKLLHWSAQFEYVLLLDSGEERAGKLKNDGITLLMAVDSLSEVSIGKGEKEAFDKLKIFHEKMQDWLFGFFSYDLKNETEALQSNNQDKLCFPLLHFFQARYIFRVQNNSFEIGYLPKFNSEKEITELAFQISCLKSHVSNLKFPSPKPTARVSEKEYLDTVKKIQGHIYQGDIYEMNYCIEFFAENTSIDPIDSYLKLNRITQTPFSAFGKWKDKFLICASPERFLKKTGNKIISQPIKGTSARSDHTDEDARLKKDLYESSKERSENVMIVDIVRNDLSRIAKEGTVKVDELFGVYTFKQVHQMISTVSCELKENTHFIDALKSVFPMGSMTGAPKIKAMQLIEQYEKTCRGLYSGAVGYIDPTGDFDFNVVIRSILYHSKDRYLSFMVGSAITAKSDIREEYKECLLKAKAMKEVIEKEKIEI